MPHPASGFFQSNNEETRQGFWAALAAFSIWAILPLYWKQAEAVSALEIICHRTLWSWCVIAPFALFTGRAAEVRQAFTGWNPALLFCSGGLLALNWLIFVWAVNNGHILETSLGNFINPLLNMICGVAFFRDRLTRLQWAAVGLVLIGVGMRIHALGGIPWIALSLPATFSLYGITRKIFKVEAVPGILVETTLFLPVALAVIWYLESHGQSLFGRACPTESALLMASGLVTALPMALFAFATRHLRLTTLGLLHYLVPTGSLFIGVYVYHESFTMSHAVTFGCIWAALAIYTFDVWRTFRPRA